MRVEILKEAFCEHLELGQKNLGPEFRRATENMIGSALVCKDVISNLTTEEKNNMAVIYASCYGEIAASFDFILSLKRDQIAKPIAFQNSLHNSPLGFLGIHLGLTGASVTVSAGADMNQGIISAAYALLSVHDKVLICRSETAPIAIKSLYEKVDSSVKNHLNESKAFLLKKISSNDPRGLDLQAINFYS